MKLEKIIILISIIVANITALMAQTIEPGSNIGDEGQVTFTYLFAPVTYKTVRLGDGSVWLRQNLGSNQVATSPTDKLSFGHLFQWGRWDDGHQVVVLNENGDGFASGTSVNKNGMPVDNNPASLCSGSNYFYYSTGTYWWKDVRNATVNAATYQDVTETNGCDPCKAIGEDWQLPSKDDWQAVLMNSTNILGVNTGVSTSSPLNTGSAFTSILRLSAAGIRSNTNGGYAQVGKGFYWSGTADPTVAGDGKAYAANFTSYTAAGTLASSRRGYGFSIRCMKKDKTSNLSIRGANNQAFCYFIDNKIVIGNLSVADIGNVFSVYDVQGKLLLKKVITDVPETIFNIDLKQGIYVTNFNGERSSNGKIVVF